MFKRLMGTLRDGSISAIATTVSQLNEMKTEVQDRINRADEINDDIFYAKAEEEVDKGTYDRGLWSKALIIANGNEGTRKIEYMKLRVNQFQQMKLSVTKDQRIFTESSITQEPSDVQEPSPVQEPPPEPLKLVDSEHMSKEELMHAYRISHERGLYRFLGVGYDNFEDALQDAERIAVK
jgi:hypothetical protein